MDYTPKQETGAEGIDGSFEFVNERNLAITLNIPAGYKQARFPSLTLISPSRSMTINSIPMLVNGDPLVRLEDKNILKEAKPPFSLESLEIIDGGIPSANPRNVMAKLSGVRLTQMTRLWINGQAIATNAVTMVSDSLAIVEFVAPMEALRWHIAGATGEKGIDARGSGALTILNPLRPWISSVSVVPGSVEYEKGKPTKATLIISGNGLHPEMTLDVTNATKGANGFGGPEKWTCSVTKPLGPITVSLMEGTTVVATGTVPIPDEPKEPSKDGNTQGVTKTTTEVKHEKMEKVQTVAGK